MHSARDPYSLYEDAEIRLYRLLRENQSLHALDELQYQTRYMALLLQSTCLALRRADLEDATRHQVRELLECQMAYQQASLQRAMKSLNG